MTDASDTDRGAASDVDTSAAGKRQAGLKRSVGAAALVAGGGVVLVSLMTSAPALKPEQPDKPLRVMGAYTPPPPPPPPASPAAAAPAPSKVLVVAPVPPKDERLEAMQRAPLTVFNGAFKGAAGTSAGASAAPLPSSGAGFVVEGEGRETNGFAKRFQATPFDVARASHIGDRRFIVAQGTSIPCVLETAMQSDQPGFVSCVITRDVLSDNGQVVLMEKGTQVVGEYRGGLQQGQSRLHVLWNRAKTPTGVVVTLASAATDDLGRAGIGGQIDTHWFERFGSALLLSIVSDASGAGGAALKAKAGVEANGTSQAGTQAAAIAVEQSGQIKPTLHKNQGEMVSIFVARDLDFSSVYGLQVTKTTGAWVEVPSVPVGDAPAWPHSGPRVQPERRLK